MTNHVKRFYVTDSWLCKILDFKFKLVNKLSLKYIFTYFKVLKCSKLPKIHKNLNLNEIIHSLSSADLVLCKFEFNCLQFDKLQYKLLFDQKSVTLKIKNLNVTYIY